MKKQTKLVKGIVFIIALICVLSSCNNNSTSDTNTDTLPHTHSYSEWEITKPASCTQEGSKERYCSCGEKQAAVISITEHIYSEWETVKEATFSEKGLETRRCECGKTETRDIAKKASETKTLTSTECLNELNAIYLNSFSQKNVWFEENEWVYARYNDGTESYAFFASEKNGTTKNKWYGQISGTYYYLEERITSTETTKTYEIISGLEMYSPVEYAGAGFQYLEYAISLTEQATTFNCKKTTNEHNTVYELTMIVNGHSEKIAITTVDELITIYDHEDYTTATYAYDKKITMPSLDGYSAAT